METVVCETCQSNPKTNGEEGEIGPSGGHLIQQIVAEDDTGHWFRGFDGFSEGSVDETEGDVGEDEAEGVGDPNVVEVGVELRGERLGVIERVQEGGDKGSREELSEA